METVLSIIIGIGLSAACGFRVFVPFLIMNIAYQSGHIMLSPNWAWVGSDYALIAFATASILEILSYYLPWLDNLMDTIATPAAISAGTIVMASQISTLSPFLQWSIALIAGGGTASAVQTGTVLVRGLSSSTTGGLGNPVFSTIELAGSVIATLSTLFIPIIAIFLISIIFLFVFFKLGKKLVSRTNPRPIVH